MLDANGPELDLEALSIETKDVLRRGVHVSTEYSGMGGAEERLRQLVVESELRFGERFENTRCVRAGDKDQCRSILVAHGGSITAPRCIFGDILARCPAADLVRLRALRRNHSCSRPTANCSRRLSTDFIASFEVSILNVSEGRAQKTILAELSDIAFSFTTQLRKVIPDPNLHFAVLGETGVDDVAHADLAECSAPAVFIMADGSISKSRFEKGESGTIRATLQGTPFVVMVSAESILKHKWLPVESHQWSSPHTRRRRGSVRLARGIAAGGGAVYSDTIGPKGLAFTPAGFVCCHRVVSNVGIVGSRIGCSSTSCTRALRSVRGSHHKAGRACKSVGQGLAFLQRAEKGGCLEGSCAQRGAASAPFRGEGRCWCPVAGRTQRGAASAAAGRRRGRQRQRRVRSLMQCKMTGGRWPHVIVFVGFGYSRRSKLRMGIAVFCWSAMRGGKMLKFGVRCRS